MLGFPGSAAIAQSDPPPGDIANIDYLGNVAQQNGVSMSGMTSINIVRYRAQDVLVAVGRFGVMTFDLADPEAPELLDHLPSTDLRLEGDSAGTFWQSESTNIDQQRKLIFLSRDPRAYNHPQNSGVSGVYVVNARDPKALELVTFHPVPAGHTSTCINNCRYLWTGGPAVDQNMPPEWGGRPIYVTDMTDYRRPYTFPDPIDIERNDGVTDYAHDVQVDNQGVAWVSGRGPVRGYWTEGRRWDPVQQRYRTATAWDPVPYAGGIGAEAWKATGPAVAHNSERPVDPTSGIRRAEGLRDSERTDVPLARDGSDYEAHGFEPGELLYVTHEDFNGPCAERGRFYIVSLRDSYNGESWRSTPDNPFRLEVLSSWHPWEMEGYDPNTANCSGHYFRMRDGFVYMSWYAQGTRVLDVRDPYNPRQVAYFRPNGGSSYTTLPYDDLVYVADSSRGVDILRLTDEAFDVADSGDEIVAPRLSEAELAAFTEQYEADPIMGWSCPVHREAQQDDHSDQHSDHHTH